MDPVCHRCGTSLSSPDELFCPHCGAPQLRYEPVEEQTPAITIEQTARRNLEFFSSRSAILSALIVAAFIAVPMGLLSSIYDFSLLWVAAGGIVSVVLYRRRVGIAPTGRVGWRIGGLAGLMAAFFSIALYGLRSAIERYALHNNEPEQLARSFAQQLAAAMNQAGRSNPQNADAVAQFTRFWLSPDGAAGIVLLKAAFFALSAVLFAAAGGVIGARIASLGSKAQPSSQ
ncbi:MAG: zinc ribbon domain-containing protein [Silvibacterium sp.]|nr:zinc ribbon domain-containing protein [Silvibacterium sp.]